MSKTAHQASTTTESTSTPSDDNNTNNAQNGGPKGPSFSLAPKERKPWKIDHPLVGDKDSGLPPADAGYFPPRDYPPARMTEDGKPLPPEGYMTVIEFAREIATHAIFVYTMLKRIVNPLPGHFDNETGRWFIHREKALAWIEERNQRLRSGEPILVKDTTGTWVGVQHLYRFATRLEVAGHLESSKLMRLTAETLTKELEEDAKRTGHPRPPH